jgi:cytochrome c556
MERYVKLGTTAAVATAVCSVAMAQVKPEDAIRARQSIMRVVALNFGPLADMGQNKIPYNKDLFLTNAARLEQVWSMDPGKFFIEGTDKPVAGSKTASFTDAKPEIWSKNKDFKASYDKVGQEIAKLAQAARTGDEKAMKTQAGEVGKACKGCHDDFRAK